MRLRASLNGRLRNTALPKSRYLLPLFEAVMNSFQAIEDAPKGGKHSIRIDVEREKTLSPSASDPAANFRITDTGVGSTDTNYESFTTVDSDYKAKRGGKGLGRFLWLKAFERVEINSHYVDPLTKKHLVRQFVFDTTDDDSGAHPKETKSGSPVISY